MELAVLNFPEKYQFNLKQKKNDILIYDSIRKKELIVTPEEWVRQHWIAYLKSNGVSSSRIILEREATINGLSQRLDILVLKKSKPFVLMELKAPDKLLNQMVWEQALRYNQVVQAPYIILSNGVSHGLFQQKNDEYSSVSFETMEW